jgi:hypothetical protein
MRKSRAARNRRIRTHGVVNRKFVTRQVRNILQSVYGYDGEAQINNTVYLVTKPKHAKSWSVVSAA